MIELFTPKTVGTVSITSGVASARVALVPSNAFQVRVKNIDAAEVAFIAFGDVTVVAVVPNGATPGSVPIGPGETSGFSIPPGTTHVASICTAGTPIVYFTPGNGN